MKNDRTAVCVFVKPPRAGASKTRLAESVGPESAAELAAAFFHDTWSAVEASTGFHSVVATTELGWCASRVPPERVWLQGAGDLGARLEQVMRRALGAHARAIAIGADSPGLPPSLLRAAERALKSYDAVLGPALDGGFYLLGLRRCPGGLLRGVPWSTRETAARTLQQLRAAGLSTKVLPRWFDVDEATDLQRLAALLFAGRVHAPKTLAWLATPAAAAYASADRGIIAGQALGWHP